MWLIRFYLSKVKSTPAIKRLLGNNWICLHFESSGREFKVDWKTVELEIKMNVGILTKLKSSPSPSFAEVVKSTATAKKPKEELVVINSKEPRFTFEMNVKGTLSKAPLQT